jgi:hypothetical protein
VFWDPATYRYGVRAEVEDFECRSYVVRTVHVGMKLYVGYPERKERFAIKKYVLIIRKKTNMQVVAHTFTNIST